MLKEINLPHLIIAVVISFVSMLITTNHPGVGRLKEMLSFYSSDDFVHDLVRKVMICTTNFLIKRNIDACFHKKLPCSSNFSFQIITCSVAHLCAMYYTAKSRQT